MDRNFCLSFFFLKKEKKDRSTIQVQKMYFWNSVTFPLLSCLFCLAISELSMTTLKRRSQCFLSWWTLLGKMMTGFHELHNCRLSGLFLLILYIICFLMRIMVWQGLNITGLSPNTSFYRLIKISTCLSKLKHIFVICFCIHIFKV